MCVCVPIYACGHEHVYMCIYVYVQALHKLFSRNGGQDQRDLETLVQRLWRNGEAWGPHVLWQPSVTCTVRSYFDLGFLCANKAILARVHFLT